MGNLKIVTRAMIDYYNNQRVIDQSEYNIIILKVISEVADSNEDVSREQFFRICEIIKDFIREKVK